MADNQGTEQVVLEGLRERKKRATRMAIQRTFLELVLERGYEGATVEDVCARVDISKKTFFNYYSSKDAVLLGSLVTFPDAAELQEALEASQDGAYFDVFLHLMRREAAGDDPQVARLRSEVYRTYPQLTYRGQHEAARKYDEIAATLLAYLSAHPERRMLPHASLSTETTVAVSAAVCVARIDLTRSACEDCPSNVEQARDLLAMFLASAQG